MINLGIPAPVLAPCDACGMHAYVQVERDSAWTWVPPEVLTFCAHHARVNSERLAESGWQISQDQRVELFANA
jgi:hypothetical protein